MLKLTGHVLAALLLIGLAGCAAPGKADVGGTVKYKGKTLAYGTVVIEGPDGITIPGTINPDGTYQVLGVTSGKVLVGVYSRDPGPGGAAAKGAITMRTKGRDADADGAGERSRWFPIPAKYEKPSESGLGTTLAPGANTFDIDLP